MAITTVQQTRTHRVDATPQPPASRVGTQSRSMAVAVDRAPRRGGSVLMNVVAI
ncbi:MAG: hypothetical protein QOI69_3429, partial [Pseudonocardiales bacterium]|nr:hypothetical protein [Pseudonocardiales bacterium]